MVAVVLSSFLSAMLLVGAAAFIAAMFAKHWDAVRAAMSGPVGEVTARVGEPSLAPVRQLRRAA